MIEELNQILGIVQVLLQVAAAYFAYRLMKITGTFRAWSLILTALVLQTVRRMIAWMVVMSFIPRGDTFTLLDQGVLPLLISLCLAAGMYELLKMFAERRRTG